MKWFFLPNLPVFIQIGEQIKRSIITGEYPPGTQIPSIRQIASEATVNPNTVQRAFFSLENEGIIISRGTAGKFVTTDIRIIEECRKKMAVELKNHFLDNMYRLNFSKEEIIEIVSRE